MPVFRYDYIMPYLFLLATMLFLMPLPVHSQDTTSWENYLEDLGEREDVDNGGLEQIYEQLSDLADAKIDINKCSREELRQLPFLSDQQVMDIMEYRDKTGRFETPMELYLIPSLDRQSVSLLRHFLVFSSSPPKDTIPSLRDVLRYGKNEMVAYFNLPFYKRKGDEDGYLGPRYKHWLRYSFNYGQRVKVGITASQDAGEPFFAGKNSKGYDYYSFFILLRDMRRLKALVVGRYRLRFGMGLVMNTSFSFGKIATLTNLYSSGNHIFGHSSRTEASYLQGAAATVTLAKGLDVTPFFSYRKIDATLAKDSQSVVTILTSGYHRTHSEMRRRRNTGETLWGGNVNYFNNGFHVGMTGFYTSFDRDLKMNNGQKYRRWYPEGSSFWDISVDYGYVSNKLSLWGETATGNNHQVATANTVSYVFSSSFTLMALQRYYPYQYFSLYARCFNEGGQENDESGVFVGCKWLPWPKAALMMYTDISYFAWPRYGVSRSSHRWDNLMQLDYAPGRWALQMRYRLKMREKDNSDKTAIIRRWDHRGRLAAEFTSGKWSLKTQVDATLSNETERSFGYMISENASWKRKWLFVRAGIGYFHTDDYSSRVYGYEPGMFYSFYFPSFYGRGMRAVVNTRASITGNLTCVLKVGSTHYFDRSTIGTALQQIDSPTKTDMEFQVKWKF